MQNFLLIVFKYLTDLIESIMKTAVAAPTAVDRALWVKKFSNQTKMNFNKGYGR